MSRKRRNILLTFILTFVFAGSGIQVGAESIENVTDNDDIAVTESADTTAAPQIREKANTNRVRENQSVPNTDQAVEQSTVPKGQVRESTSQSETGESQADSNSEESSEDDSDPDPESDPEAESESESQNGDGERDTANTEGLETETSDATPEEQEGVVSIETSEEETGATADDTDVESAPAAETLPAEEPTENEEALDNTHRFPSLTIGETPTERYFTWYSDNFDQGYFEIAVANPEADFTNGQIIEGTTFTENNTQNAFNEDFPDLSNTQVHITDLERNTEYMYRFWNGDGEKSEIYHFETHAPGDFSFVAIGDAQLGSSGDLESDIAGWEETLSKFPEINEDPHFILSVGDQVEWAWSEEEYAGFIEQEGLNEETLVPVIGNHDTYFPAFSEHFALPNVQDEGQTEAGSNYYFVYNDALFTILNLENTNYEEHEKTLQTAITETQTVDPKWHIVSFHRSLYSPANHSDSQATADRRANMAPLMNKYDVDLVLSGHDHAYARSHVMDGTTPIVEWEENGNAPTTYVNPDGVIYITLNSSSGSKFYGLKDDYEYLAVRNQEEASNLSNVTVTDEYIEVVTYRTEDLSIVDQVTTEADRYIPETDQVVLFEDAELPSAAEGVVNSQSLPENAQYNWVTTPDTSIVGSFTETIEIVYADGTSEQMDVAVEIIENRDDALEEQEFGNMQPQDPTDNSIDISVISDTHLLSDELISDHPEYLEMINSEKKLFTQSEQAFRDAVQQIEENGSQIIFIPGDLTRDNERASYELFVEVMTEFVEGGEGRRIFVVPGNHDINNPAAYNYNVKEGENPESLGFFTPADFMEIFGPLVYDQALALYKDSDYFNDYLAEVNATYDRAPENEYFANGYLTYVSRVDIDDEGKNGLTVIGIDSAIYSADTNSNNQDVRETGGIITEPHMQWIVDQINAAHGRNDVVTILSHHAFIPHFPGQADLLDEFILRNWNAPYASTNPQIDGKTPLEVIADSGVSYLFTGHLHGNDISSATTENGNTLYDIETGSLVTHPIPVRHMILTNQIDSSSTGHQLVINTDYIKELEYLNPGKEIETIEDFGEYSWEFLIDSEYISSFVADSLDQIPPVKELVVSLVVSEELSQLPPALLTDLVTPTLVELIASSVGTAENPALNEEIALGITVSVYWDEVTNGSGEKLALNLDAGILGTHNLMVTEENLELFIDELFASIDGVLQNEAFLYDTVNNLAQAILDFPVVTDENGNIVASLQDVAEQAYIGHLAGEEFNNQPAWMSTVLYRFNNENVLYELVQYLEAPLIDTLNNLLSAITFDLGEKIEIDGNFLEQATSALPLGLIRGILPTDLNSVVELVIDYPALISFLLDLDMVANEVNVYNPLLADLIEGFTNELAKDQAQYVYLFDNDTTLAKQLNLLNYNGEIVFTSPTEFTFVSNFDTNAIEKIYVSIDGTVYELSLPTASSFAESRNVSNSLNFNLANLANGLSFENGNQVAVRVLYPNEFGNLITLTSPIFQYIEETVSNEIGYEVVYVYSPNVPVGEEAILTNGQNGVEQVTYIVNDGDVENPENWIEIGRVQTSLPVNQVVGIGFDKDALSDRVETLENRINELEAEQARLKEAIAQLINEVESIDLNLNAYAERIQALEQSISELEAQLADYSNENAGQEETATEQEDNESIIIPGESDNNKDSADKVDTIGNEKDLGHTHDTVVDASKADEIVSANAEDKSVEKQETLPQTSVGSLAGLWMGLLAIISGLGINLVLKKED